MTRSKRGTIVHRLATMMDAHSRALKAAGADADVVAAYDAVVRYVRAEGATFVSAASVEATISESPHRPDKEISNLSIEEVGLLLERDDLQRSELEQVAIHRFGVPKGSMRKWSRKEDLRDKVLTMLGNERKHRAIGEVARSKIGLTTE